MIYQETYFDDCHGVIPQIVLSSMLLQAGNIRASAYKNALTVDLSTANTFSFNGYFLELQGILPFTESRYLLTVPSIINRVGAMNGENVSMLNDLIGLPVNGFIRTTANEVTLPPNIDNLSQGVLVLEKRLAYLLLLQAKRNNLNTLYNYLYYTTLASDITRRSNTKVPVTTTVGGGATTSPSGATYTSGYTYISGFIYGSISEPQGRSTIILSSCIRNLFATYPSLIRPLPNNFADICDWLEVEMVKSDPITLPDLDFDLLVGNIAEIIEALRYIESLHDPQGLVPNDAIDVSSEIGPISGIENGSAPTLELPVNVYTDPGNLSPLEDRPSANNSSLTGSSPKTDPLPPC